MCEKLKEALQVWEQLKAGEEVLAEDWMLDELTGHFLEQDTLEGEICIAFIEAQPAPADGDLLHLLKLDQDDLYMLTGPTMKR